MDNIDVVEQHALWKGKIEITSRVGEMTKDMLKVAYTPGVAKPCLEIQKDYNKSFDLTRRSNLVAVITDGTAVLGLGDIGPEAGMPVMEGKCVLFKSFANVDAFPLCLRSKDVDELVRTIYLLSGSFGGINLEDIAAPRCFEIEKKLKEICDIPVFHDDQHGTAIVVASALINSLKLIKKDLKDAKIVINGAGSAGISIATLLLKLGMENIIMCDIDGILSRDDTTLEKSKHDIASRTNKELKKGLLADALVGADIFVGVSAANVLKKEMIQKMADKPIIFAMANPNPEIMPEPAKEAGAYVVGTGRSDYPNQINNVLAFPGIFRGALDVRAKQITEEMKVASVYAIAGLVSDEELSPEYVIPSALDKRVALSVAKAVAKSAMDNGIAQKEIDLDNYEI